VATASVLGSVDGAGRGDDHQEQPLPPADELGAACAEAGDSSSRLVFGRWPDMQMTIELLL
jgi:hypothetical protein